MEGIVISGVGFLLMICNVFDSMKKLEKSDSVRYQTIRWVALLGAAFFLIMLVKELAGIK